ncbi:hypothetical protein AAFN47_20125 [Hoeflea sp. CAU 1731]
MTRQKTWLTRLLSIIAVLLLCLPSPAGASPKSEILFIFNHGSSVHYGADCYIPLLHPRPQWLNDIDNRYIDGLKVRVVTPCTGFERGANPDENGCNQVWVCNRAKFIVWMIERYLAQGYPPEHIFVGGHSAGGWASLLIKRWKPELFNGVIVTAPAFNGKRRSRMCKCVDCTGEPKNKWNSFHRYWHENQLGLMGPGRPDLRALVFTFLCDPYARPAELTFDGNPHVKTEVYPTGLGSSLSCANTPDSKRYRLLEKDRHVSVERCDEPKANNPEEGLACGSGKDDESHPSYATILNCPDGMREICDRNQHTRTHRSDDFRKYIASNRLVIDFLEKRLKDWRPPAPSSHGRTPCSFIDFPKECPSYRY